MDPVIELNVSGEHITVLRSTLCCIKDCMLSKMFAPDSPLNPASQDSQGRYFFPYNASVFKFVIEYLKRYEGKLSHDNIEMSETMLQLIYQAPFDDLMESLDYFNIPQAKQLIFDQDPLYNHYYEKEPSEWNSEPNVSLAIVSENTLVLIDKHQPDHSITCQYIRDSRGISFFIPGHRQRVYNIRFTSTPELLEGWRSYFWDKVSHPPLELSIPGISLGDRSIGKCSHQVSPRMVQVECDDRRYTSSRQTPQIGTYITLDLKRYIRVDGDGPPTLFDLHVDIENGNSIERLLNGQT
eukprot:gb/GECH01014492.1/.p1 GENE.gb/GECH01014492.1/~~gb/GECH01014492.1/.p1  ORF type:complete len:296 (+),score=31.71 gb/GECH01014492.1/:1-888(+)